MREPHLKFEKKLWRSGYRYVAGADEVGRGCFAGPVAAAAVVFSSDITMKQFNNEARKIDDSKKLTKLQRERADKWIRKNVVTWGVGEASAKVINRFGMGKSTQMVFRKAVVDANRRLHNRIRKPCASRVRIEYLLIDAFYVPYIRGFPRGKVKIKARKNPAKQDSRAKQLAIVNGDEKSISIAAASIVAKVYRDSLMEKIGSRQRYKKFDWINNKGYATKYHRDAILKHGITGYHRKQFVETFLNNFSSSRVRFGA